MLARGVCRAARRPPPPALRLLLLALMLAACAPHAARARRYAPDDLAAPQRSGDSVSNVCTAGYGPSYVCDPAGLISRERRRALDRAMAALARPPAVDETSNPLRACDGGLQVRATVVRFMATNDAPSTSVAAERFAKELLIDWDLGNCGVLIFVSMGDKHMYIATGQSATKLLPKHRIRHIISDMKPYLRRGDPASAFLVAVHDIERDVTPTGHHQPASAPAAVAGTAPAQKRARSKSFFWGWELTATVIVAAIAIVFALRNGKGGSERTQLKKLMAPDHCSLCLQPFEHSGTPVSPDDHSPSGEEGVLPDDAVVLTCGHMFHRTRSCWLNWTENMGSENCPLCSATAQSTSDVETENVERQFKLERIRALYPELESIATKEIRRRQRAIDRVHRRQSRQQRIAARRQQFASRPAHDGDADRTRDSGGPNVLGLLGAGAVGAALGSALSGSGQHQQQGYGGTSQSMLGGIGGGGGLWGSQGTGNAGGQGGGWGNAAAGFLGGAGNVASGFLGGAGGGWGGSSNNTGGVGGGWGGSSSNTGGFGGGWGGSSNNTGGAGGGF